MTVHRPLAILSLSALLLVGLAFVRNAEVSVHGDADEARARAGIEGEGDIPVPIAART